MAKRYRLGDAAPLKLYGYPKDNGTRLTDGHGKTIAKGRKVNCTKVRGDQPGGWISNERCSYQFKFQGLWYGCRGHGDGLSASCRVMKRAPVDQRGRNVSNYYDKLDGARRRR